MRLATYNVHHGAPTRGPVDLDRTIEVCRVLDADLLAVQELDSGVARSGGIDQPRALSTRLGLHAAFAAPVRIGEDGRYGHALFARHPLTDVEQIELTVTPGREHRTALLATVELDGTLVEVCALHLENPRQADVARPTALEQARFAFDLIVARAERSGRPAVVLGDLNVDPARIEPLATAAGFDLAAGSPTFPSRRPRVRIDHVAVRGLRVEATDVPAAEASDHRPLLVLAVPDRGPLA